MNAYLLRPEAMDFAPGPHKTVIPTYGASEVAPDGTRRTLCECGHDSADAAVLCASRRFTPALARVAFDAYGASTVNAYDTSTVNANGTLNLLEAARRHCPDASFVFTSSGISAPAATSECAAIIVRAPIRAPSPPRRSAPWPKTRGRPPGFVSWCSI